MKAVVEIVAEGCGTDTQKTQMARVEMNFSNLRRSDTNPFMDTASQSVFNYPKLGILDTTESSSLICVRKEWKTRYGALKTTSFFLQETFLFD